MPPLQEICGYQGKYLSRGAKGIQGPSPFPQREQELLVEKETNSVKNKARTETHRVVLPVAQYTFHAGLFMEYCTLWPTQSEKNCKTWQAEEEDGQTTEGTTERYPGLTAGLNNYRTNGPVRCANPSFLAY